MRPVLRRASLLFAVASFVGMAGVAGAAPIVVDQSAFVGPPPVTVIDFEGIVIGTPITNQYAAQGVTFEGTFGQQGTARNYSVAEPVPGAITINFTNTMLRAGFDLTSANATGELTVAVSAYSGNSLVQTGVFNFPNVGGQSLFVGIEDALSGIDRLVLSEVTVNPAAANRMVIDNLRFQAAPPALVPEPSAALLFPTGLLLAAYGTRRRRQSA